jgi:hypothetical protein
VILTEHVLNTQQPNYLYLIFKIDLVILRLHLNVGNLPWSQVGTNPPLLCGSSSVGEGGCKWQSYHQYSATMCCSVLIRTPLTVASRTLKLVSPSLVKVHARKGITMFQMEMETQLWGAATQYCPVVHLHYLNCRELKVHVIQDALSHAICKICPWFKFCLGHDCLFMFSVVQQTLIIWRNQVCGLCPSSNVS